VIENKGKISWLAGVGFEPRLPKFNWAEIAYGVFSLNPARYFYPATQSRDVTATPATVGSIEGQGPFHELQISPSFYEGQTHGQRGRAACA
jgi:hypothetical protein